MSEEEESNSRLSDRVVLKGKDRILPGFELEKGSKWKSPFFFVQAADTQLGLIANYGDGTIFDQVLKLTCLQSIVKNDVYKRSSFSA